MYPNLTLPLAVLLGAAVLVGAWIAGSQPILRRLALRQAVRRPAESGLVVLGALLGTAMIASSLVVGDTLHASVLQTAYTNLGPIDEVVASPTIAQGAAAAARLAPLRTNPDIKGLLNLQGDQAPVLAGTGSGRRAEPQAYVWALHFRQAATFGSRTAASGLSGPAPAPGFVVINSALASSLRVGVGAPLTFYLYGHPRIEHVARIVPTMGVAGAGLGGVARDAFFPAGTLGRLAAAAGVHNRPEAFTFVSNVGGVLSGNRVSNPVALSIHRALGPLARKGTSVEKVKQAALRAATQAGNGLGGLFLFLGSFSMIAGVLLLVNIFVMLAEERKRELGIARALGMRRRQLVQGFALEGMLYGTVASVAGIPVGIGLGFLVAATAASLASGGQAVVPITFSVSAVSVFNSFAIGFLMAFITIIITSVRISRLNVISAIRDLPAHRTRRVATPVMILAAVLGIGAGVASIPLLATGTSTTALLLPSLAVIGLTPLARRIMGSTPALTVAAGLVLLWNLLAPAVRPGIFSSGSTSPFVILGTLLTASAVVLATLHQSLLQQPLRRLLGGAGRTGQATRLAVAYALAKKFRTGAILSMYALVIFTLVLITIFGSMEQAAVGREVASASGGYSLRVQWSPSAPIPHPVTALSSGRFRSRVAAVVPLLVGASQVTHLVAADTQPLATLVIGAPASIDQAGLLPLYERPAGMSNRMAWQQLLTNPNAVVLDRLLGQSGASPTATLYHPGSTLVLTDPATGRSEHKVVVGVLDSAFAFYGLGGFPVIESRAAVAAQFGIDAQPTAALIATRPGASAATLAADLQGQYVTHGLVARQIKASVQRNAAANESFFRLMQGFLALGLVVGIAGLGVVMVRAVRERRRSIGVLRSLGFPRGTIRQAFLTESAFVAFQGIVIGTVLGIVTSDLLFGHDHQIALGVPFVVPWSSIATLVVAIALISVAATLWPAERAARIEPASVLRTSD